MALKIAIVAESISRQRGGAETSMAQFMHHLLRNGLHVELYTTSNAAPACGLTVHRIDVQDAPRALRTPCFARRADELLAAHSCDVVHATAPCRSADIYQPRGGALPESIARNLAMQRSGAMRTLKRLANRLNLKQQTLLRMERALLERTPPPLVAAVSDYVRRQFVLHYRLDRRLLHLVYNAVSYHPRSLLEEQTDRDEIRRTYAIQPSEVLALVVAHNFKLKGLSEWLQALRILKDRSQRRFRTLVIGRGSPQPYLRIAQGLNVGDWVTFTGATQRVEAFFAAADLLIHPTYYDPCSRVVLEAMLHRLPCVTTRYNGAAEAIEDGVTGRVIDDPTDLEALAGAAEDLAAPAYRSALQARHDSLVERLSMNRHAREMIELYQSVKGSVVHP